MSVEYQMVSLNTNGAIPTKNGVGEMWSQSLCSWQNTAQIIDQAMLWQRLSEDAKAVIDYIYYSDYKSEPGYTLKAVMYRHFCVRKHWGTVRYRKAIKEVINFFRETK